MPIIGWFIGSKVEPFVKSFDHWIAFILLLYIGINMIKESYSNEEGRFKTDPSKGKNMVMLSIGTSIDALVVGFSFAMLRIDIWYPSAIIGVTTASLSIIGILIGEILGEKFGKLMERIGGLIISESELRYY